MSGPGRLPQIESPTAVLSILAFINFINYLDRQVIGPIVPLLQAPVADGGLALTSFQVGLLQLAFMVVHSVASIPLGIMADRFMRKKIIAFGVGVWSIATALAGLANSFAQMFVARAAVGVGEAAYAPAASALISDKFPAHQRARALGMFQVGMMLGGASAVVIAGQIGGHYGWRAAFLIVGVPGLLLTLLALMIKEAPPTLRPRPQPGGPIDPHASLAGASLALDTRHMMRSPAVVWINLAGVGITFFVGALIFWAPKFILHYHYDDNVDHLEDATLLFGMVAAPGVLAGTIFGSFLADRLEKRRPGEGRLLTVALGVLLSVPLALIGFFADHMVVLCGAIGLGVFFNSWYVGPVLAALHDVVPAYMRGTATGVYLLVIHLLGDAISPAVVGFVSDETGSLRLGLAVAVGMLALGGLAALMAMRASRKLTKLKQSQPAG